MDNKTLSIYDLITKLCEKCITSGFDTPYSNAALKRARSKSYEVLLGKKLSGRPIIEDLENITDPVCHLLAWEVQLATVLNRSDCSEKLRKCTDKLEKLNVFNNTTYTNVVLLLLQLKQIPCEKDTIMETTLNKDNLGEPIRTNMSYRYFEDDIFKLPRDPELINFFDDSRFRLCKSRSDKLGCNNSMKMLDFNHYYKNLNFNDHFSTEILLKDESDVSLLKDDLWENASKIPFDEHRTWEAFGCYSPNRELPFISEAGPKPTGLLQDLASSITSMMTNEKELVVKNTITHKNFIKNLKYLLVHIESDMFKYNEEGEMYLVPNTCIEGLSYSTLKSYCKDFIFASSCYRALRSLCAPNLYTLKYKCEGYIFAEMCESIKRYLLYYQVMVHSIPTSTSILSFREATKQLHSHLKVLAAICKVGSFEENGQTPNGTILLNNFYQKILSTTDESILMVLYSVLHPCCQVYYLRFLQQWILEGVINDPYDEFFIKVNPKYITTHGRTYWTRGFTIREDVVPDFVANLCHDVLFCGKAMNLLKLCVPDSPLCLYFSNKHPDLIFCCMTNKQLVALEQNNNTYYLEATAICGPRMLFSEIISRTRPSDDDLFLGLIAKKRKATLARIELERKKVAKELYKKKQLEMQELKTQYEEALKKKEIKAAEVIRDDLKLMEKNLTIHTLHNRIIENEATNLIDYYKELFKASEDRRNFFEKRIEYLRKIQLELSPPIKPGFKTSDTSSDKDSMYTAESSSNSNENLIIKDSQESYYSTWDDLTEKANEERLAKDASENLDVINANAETESTFKTQNADITSAKDTFKEAAINKAKVLALEMGIVSQDTSSVNKIKQDNFDNSNLTGAQRNKLKVMSSEFGFDFYKPITEIKRSQSIMETNKQKIMSSNECFYSHESAPEKQEVKKKIFDNQNYINENVSNNNINEEEEEVKTKESQITDSNLNITGNWVRKKQDTLLLDLTRIDDKPKNISKSKTKDDSTKLLIKSPKFELDKVSPMSIDSTPLSGFATPSNRLTLSQDFDSLTTVTATATTSYHENGFDFEINKTEELRNAENRKANLDVDIDYMKLSRNITNENVSTISPDCLKKCLTESIVIPLVTQTKLLTNELFKYFISDLQYLRHLSSLRNYFFLLDGEFGRNITENLFEKLYDANFPIDLINGHTLQDLVYQAIGYSTKFQENSSCLSFRINNLPKVFDLRDPDIFDCISLTYKVTWPLNILLPSETIGKYDDVFKFLLKLHRVSWVLQNVFQDLKLLLKQTEKTQIKLLINSFQYRRLQRCRHVMTHFIQTLQNYVVGEVLQSSWEIFEKNLESVTSLDQMYTLHTVYIKNILFMCLLNQKSAPMQKVLQKIFIVILKFYDYLRCCLWVVKNGCYSHPNFEKLDILFDNFEELVAYFFKVGHKVVRSGYQPYLLQLLDMLDVNNYYTNKNGNVTYSNTSS